MALVWQSQMMYKEECIIKWSQRLVLNLLCDNHLKKGKEKMKGRCGGVKKKILLYCIMNGKHLLVAYYAPEIIFNT